MEEKIIREGFVFYRSFIEAANCLDDAAFRELITAICHYALDGQKDDLSGAISGMFQLIKPQIDANNKRYENGLKGGRPKNQSITKAKPNNNQTITKQKPNNNQTITKAEPKEKDKVKEKVKVNDNDKVNDKEKGSPPEGAIMIHDDNSDDTLQKTIVSQLNNNQPIPEYYFKYLNKWINDYGENFIREIINRLDDNSKTLTGLMIEVTSRTRKGTH